MKRVASIVTLPPEHQEQYLKLHREVWPAVRDILRAAVREVETALANVTAAVPVEAWARLDAAVLVRP